MNSKLLTLLLVTSGLLFLALLTHNGGLAWMALPFLFYLGTGILKAPAAERIRLSASRQVERSAAQEDPDVSVQVTVHNLGVPIDRLLLYDPCPKDMQVTEGEPAIFTALHTGAEETMTYSFRHKRGRYKWEAVRAVASDALGLTEIIVNVQAPAEIQVQPEREYLHRLKLRPHSTLHSPGSIPARIGGSGTDFWGVREYHPGDSLRWLDWRLTARHPYQFFTKEFEQEEIADIGLILDARQVTDLKIGPDSLFEHSVRAAASLAEVFLHQGHRLGLLIFNGSMHTVFPGYGKLQLSRVMQALAQAKTGATSSFDSLGYLPLHMFSSRATLIVFSPLILTDWAFFPRLRAHGYQGLLISPDPFSYASRTFPSDRVSQLALRAARIERRLELRDIAQLQIPVIDWQVSDPLYPQLQRAIGSLRGRRER